MRATPRSLATKPVKAPPTRPVSPLFQWSVVFRYVVYGALPLIAFFIAVEKLAGEGSLGFAVLFVAAMAPLLAVGWLAYQNIRKR